MSLKDLEKLATADRFPVREWNKHRKILTPGEEIQKAIEELDLEQVQENFLATYYYGIWNRLKSLLMPARLLNKTTRLKQLAFLTAIKTRVATEMVNVQAYIFLGGFRYVQGRWGEFPATGPLYEMVITKNHLERVIGEFGGEVKLPDLLVNPQLIAEQADQHFNVFLQNNQDLLGN